MASPSLLRRRIIGLSLGFWLLIAVMALIRFAVMFGTGPIHDEAYYWSWSQRLDFGYYDQPFLTGLVLWPFVTLLGDQAWVLRLVASLLALLTTVFLALTLTRLTSLTGLTGLKQPPLTAPVQAQVKAQDQDQAQPAQSPPPVQTAGETPVATGEAGLMLLVVSSPLLWGLGLLYVHDSVMMACLFAGLWLGVEALVRPAGRTALPWWLAAGMMLGLAFSAKLSAALWIFALGLGLLLHRGGWRHLRSLGPWLAAGLILLHLGLFLLWNALNAWVTFAHVMNEHLSLPPARAVDAPSIAASATSLVDRLGRLGLLWLTVALLSGPAAFILVLRYGHSLRRAPVSVALALFVFVPLLVFSGLAWLREVYLNWILASCLGLMLIGAMFWPAKTRRWQVLASLPSALISLALLLPIALKEPRFMLANARDMLGWEGSIQRLIDYRNAQYPGHSIVGNYYQLAAQVAFHQDAILPSVGTDPRPHQFRLYADTDGLLLAPLLVLTETLEQGQARLEAEFCHVLPVAPWPVNHRASRIAVPYLFEVRRPRSLGPCTAD